MSLHHCIEADCPDFTKPSARHCGCHQTDEVVLRERNAVLLEALREAHRSLMMYEWYNNPKSGWAPDDKTTVRGTVEAALAEGGAA